MNYFKNELPQRRELLQMNELPQRHELLQQHELPQLVRIACGMYNKRVDGFSVHTFSR